MGAKVILLYVECANCSDHVHITDIIEEYISYKQDYFDFCSGHCASEFELEEENE